MLHNKIICGEHLYFKEGEMLIVAETLPYSTVPHRAKDFLEKIPALGIPAKMTIKELELRGFRSSNDRSIMRVLKALRLLDESGTPTDVWRQYRDRKTNRMLLARLIRGAYPDLFATFPNAQEQTETELANFMSTKTGSPAATVQFMVKTFKSLCTLADFEDEEFDGQFITSRDEGGHKQNEGRHTSGTTTYLEQTRETSMLSGLQISLHLPVSDNPAIYDAIFRSFARHILGRKDEDTNDETDDSADLTEAQA